MQEPAFFFDLDGTLMDSAPGIIASYKVALKELDVEPPTNEELRAMVGPPMHLVFPMLLGDHAPIEEAISVYREYYEDEGMFIAEPYDGLAEMFDELARFDPNIYIATSKPQKFADQIAEQFGLFRYAQRLFGSELDGTRSDKTELLQFALDETGALPEHSVMIGDRHYDINGARNNDIPSIGALWGYGEPDELRMAEPDGMAGHPEEVPEIALDIMGLELD
ncbi:MAG: HAD hydrolase-like protein, partial [Pseudomonadota bacterium]